METFPVNTWWRNRIGTTVLPEKYADRSAAAQHGSREARERGLDHVVTFTGNRRLRAVRDPEVERPGTTEPWAPRGDPGFSGSSSGRADRI